MSIEAKYANQDLDSKALKSISVTCLKTVYWMKLRANPQPSLFSEPPWQPHGKRRMPWGHTWKSALDLPAITRRHLHYLVSAQAFSISNQLFRKYLAHAWHTCSHPPFCKRHIYIYITAISGLFMCCHVSVHVWGHVAGHVKDSCGVL